MHLSHLKETFNKIASQLLIDFDLFMARFYQNTFSMHNFKLYLAEAGPNSQLKTER